MQTESYVRIEELLKARESKAEELNKRKELCKELGLKVQEKFSAFSLLSPDMFCKRLSDKELKIWRMFLPTTSYRGDSLVDYRYDLIPTEVLQDWKLVKDLGLFESFEIQTPELKNPDPILIGIRKIGDKDIRYLIARWGESLIPFKEIRLKVAMALKLARARIRQYEDSCKQYQLARLAKKQFCKSPFSWFTRKSADVILLEEPKANKLVSNWDDYGSYVDRNPYFQAKHILAGELR